MFKFTYTNHLMDECLKELEAYWADEDAIPVGSADLLVRLLLNRDIVRHKGCYLLQSRFDTWPTDPDGEFVPDQYMHRSDYEDRENHLHIWGSLDDRKPSIGWLGVGLAMVEILRLKLMVIYPAVRFAISVSYPVKAIADNDKYIKNDCRVSFNAIREGEDNWGDPEAYQYEAMGILEI